MSAKSRVLRRLTEGPATTAQLCQPEVGGIRFGARIAELRAEGHAITESRLRRGSSRYVLVGVERGDGPPSVVSPSFDPEEGGRFEVRHVEPLPSQAHEWEHVLRFTPGEITAEYWRRATPMQQAMAA